MKAKYFLCLFLGLLSFLSSCSDDHGLAPLPGRLLVDIKFHGTPPANTQGIYLIVTPDFPPHAINELFHSSNSLPIGLDSVHTEIDLPLGHYDAISLWWYSNDTKSNLADVLSLPLDINNNLLPLGFDLTTSQPQHQMNLVANWDKVNRDASIEGTIYFNGPFPVNTLATAVAAYRYKPTVSVEYLTFLKSIDFSVGTNPYHFKLPVRNGNIEYLAVFWLPENSNLTEFQTIGVYENPAQPGEPAKFRVKTGEALTGLDIQADWSKISNPQ